MKIRKIIFDRDEPTGARSVLDIIETEVPPVSDVKAHAAFRRKLLRDLDRQLDGIFSGEIDEISFLLGKG